MKYVIPFGLFTLLAGLGLGCGGKNASPSGEKGADVPSVTAPETSEEAMKGLAGNWRVTSIKNLPPNFSPDVKHVTAQIRGNTIELSEPVGYLSRGEIRLAPAKSPKHFDLILLDEKGKPKTVKFFTTGGPDDGKQLEQTLDPVRGLYSLDGDRLTLALTDRDDYRPTELKHSVMENTGAFVTVNRRGSTYVTIVELARVKDGDPKGAGADAPDESSREGVARWFLTAFRSRDVDGVLKVSAAPFLIELDSAKNARVVEKPGDLKAELRKLMDGWRKIDEFPAGIVESGGWGRAGIPRKEVEALNDPQDRVREYGGYYVIPRISAGPNKGGRAKMKLLLKKVEGKFRVVGLVTGNGATEY
ncbi:MAG TPA: TIGR03067 domain-containing protein [Gemmata sp.]